MQYAEGAVSALGEIRQEEEKELSGRAGWKFLVAGLIASAVELILTYPVENIKVTYAINSEYSRMTMVEAITKIPRMRGFKAMYAGLAPALLSALIFKSVKFATYGQVQGMLMALWSLSDPTAFISIIAGIVTGFVESIVMTPFEVVKISMINDSLRTKPQFTNWLQCARKIVKGRGILNGLTNGFWPTTARQMTFSTIYFIVYAHFKRSLLRMLSMPWMAHSVSGFMAGVFGSMANMPFDNCKSRIQSQSHEILADQKYSTTWQVMNAIVKERGFKGLYSGLSWKLLRLGPGSALVFVVYEYILSLLN